MVANYEDWLINRLANFRLFEYFFQVIFSYLTPKKVACTRLGY